MHVGCSARPACSLSRNDNRIKVAVRAFSTNVPRRADAVTRNVSIMTQQLMIAFNDAPWSDSDANQTARTLLALQQQSVADLPRNTYDRQERD